jgi:hypothetical protein
MKGKYKMTGCARFLIFLLIMAPIAYFGSKYLRESGTWDKVKDKLEETTDRTAPKKTDETQLPRDRSTSDRDDKSSAQAQTESVKNDRTISDQEKRIEELERQLEEARSKRQELPRAQERVPEPSSRSSQSTTTPTGENVPSLDDLLREADLETGASTGDNRTTRRSDQSAVRNTLGSWSFSFDTGRNVMEGTIEFFAQEGRLFSDTRVRGDNALDIDELDKSGDRFSVRDSPTREYYVLRRDGDLDAFDQNGFQVTCRRLR